MNELLLFALLVGVTYAQVSVVQIGFKCPKNFPCTCESKTQDEESVNLVNCRSKGLRKVPDFGRINMRDTICIDLSNNSLRSVPRGKFKGLRIKWVKFDNNPMKKGMHEKAFEEVDEVNSILCRNCSLPMVPKIFKYTDGLEILDVENNNISKIASGTFKETGLKELYAGKNVFFPAAHMFSDLVETLERLSLSRSFLFKVPVKAVAKLYNLKRLDLQYNFIPEIKKSQMAMMPKNLTYLDFSNNPIEKIEYGSFEDFINNREGVTVNFIDTKITTVDFIEDACRLNKVFMPLKGAPLVCDCNLYNITRNNVLNTTGYCDKPDKYKWFSIYGDKSFVSETYENEGEVCPKVWKLPCTAVSHRSAFSILVTSLLVVKLLRN